MSTFFTKLAAVCRRVFFWLPSARPEEEMPHLTHHDHALVINVTGSRKVPTLLQLRYASRVLSTNERRAVSLALIVFVGSLLATVGTFAAHNSTTIPATGGTLTEGLVGTPKYINPIDAIANDVDSDLTSLIFSGLFRTNGTTIEPDLAEKYQWSSDGKTLTVTMRSDAVFHNGDPVTADDVQFTIESIQDPKRSSPLEPLFRDVTVLATDTHTVQFTLPRQDSRFLTLLTVGILPSELWQNIPAVNARLADLNIKPIGSGPYQFKSFTRDSHGQLRSYTLERFNRWYGVKPLISTLTFQFFTTKDEAEASLKTGAIDTFAFVDTSDWRKGEITRWQNVGLNLPEETVAFFNLKKPFFADENVRRALAGVVDRQEIVAAWKGNGAPVTSPFPFMDGPATTMTLDDARALLDKAGWTLPQGGNVRIRTVKPKNTTTNTSKKKTTKSTEPVAEAVTPDAPELSLTILTLNQPELTATAEVLKQRWSLLGIKVVIETLDQDDLLRRATRERNEDIVVTNILLGPEQDLFPFWWSGQIRDRGLNISNISDRAVDTALENIRLATSTVGVEAGRKQLTDQLAKDIPAVFLIRPTSAYFVSPRIHGVPPSITLSRPSDRFQSMRTWYIKTGWSWR